MIHNLGSRWIFIILCCDGGQENMTKKLPLRKNTYPFSFQLDIWTMDVHNLAVKFLYFIMFIVLLYLSGIIWNVLKQHMNVLPSHVVVFPAFPMHQSSSVTSWGFTLRLITWAFSRSVAKTHPYFLPHVNYKKKQPQLAGTLRSAFNRQVPHHFWEPHLFPCTERQKQIHLPHLGWAHSTPKYCFWLDYFGRMMKQDYKSCVGACGS